MIYDAVIEGAGPAGLEAALMLGRACRRVRVCGDGAPRNAAAAHSHGFLTRDGVPPLELLRLARADLAAYPNVELSEDAVVDGRREGEGFVLTTRRGEELRARGVVVASGVRDVLPDLPGLAEVWGDGAFFCPFCHGWELRGKALAVLGQDDYALHMVFVLKAWTSDVTLLANGPLRLKEEQVEKLRRNQITVHEGTVARLEHEGRKLVGVAFSDGTTRAQAAVLLKPPALPRSNLLQRLGAELGPDGMPVVDPFYQTSVPGLFAAGDLVQRAPMILGAAATGALAGAGLSNTMALRDAERA